LSTRLPLFPAWCHGKSPSVLRVPLLRRRNDLVRQEPLPLRPVLICLHVWGGTGLVVVHARWSILRIHRQRAAGAAFLDRLVLAAIRCRTSPCRRRSLDHPHPVQAQMAERRCVRYQSADDRPAGIRRHGGGSHCEGVAGRLCPRATARPCNRCRHTAPCAQTRHAPGQGRTSACCTDRQLRNDRLSQPVSAKLVTASGIKWQFAYRSCYRVPE
jgi:hypothetical protein